MAAITKNLVRDHQKRAKAGEIPKPLEIRDSDLKGFILRVQPSGRASYIVQLGRGKRITLGDAAVLTPSQARTKAKCRSCGRASPLAAADQRQDRARAQGP